MLRIVPRIDCTVNVAENAWEHCLGWDEVCLHYAEALQDLEEFWIVHVTVS